MISGDIFGAQVGSLVHGIRVPSGMKQREMNPLDPVYNMPGHSENVHPNDAFGGSSMDAIAKAARQAKQLAENKDPN